MEPRILILDDATASVDATTEAKIRLGLREAMKGRTTIIIAHRLSTISLADELVVLDGGRIVGRGTRRGAAPDERRVPRHPRARAARARVRGPRGGEGGMTGHSGDIGTESAFATPTAGCASSRGLGREARASPAVRDTLGGRWRVRVWQPGGHLTSSAARRSTTGRGSGRPAGSDRSRARRAVQAPDGARARLPARRDRSPRSLRRTSRSSRSTTGSARRTCAR